MNKIAVLLPCYNESKTIEKVVKDFKNVFSNSEYDVTIYVYDNNSSDGTDKIAEAAGAQVRYEYKQGKGNVIRRMFQEIDADCYIMADGDDTYPAENAPEMAELVLKKSRDMVVGDRLSSTYFTENKRPFHNMGNRVVRASINSLFKSDIKDIMTGYRAFSKRFVKSFPVLSQGFEIETEMTIHAIHKNMLLDNVIIEYKDRPEGSVSKLNTISDGIKVLKTVVRLWKNYKPLGFFSLIALFLVLADFAVFIPAVLIPYINTGCVDNFPTLIICGFVAMAALLFFFSGLLLDAISSKERREFEFRLQVLEQLDKK